VLDLLKRHAHVTRDDAMAIRHYVLAENEIMRSKIAGRVPVTPEERRSLNRLGRQALKQCDEVFTIASAS
jgi:hypothetical protein